MEIFKNWSEYPGEPIWRLWHQFDVIWSSFCRRDDINLMSKFSSNFTSILTSYVNEKNWRHQLFDINLTVILTVILTSIWRHFDINLTSIWRHFDIIFMSPMMLSMTSFSHQRLTSFDVEIFGQFRRQFSHQMLTKIIDVTSIPWPEFDLILTSDVWLLLMYIWCQIDVYLMSNGCQIDVKLMSIWCQIDVYLMSN